jgi:hypothetical protein
MSKHLPVRYGSAESFGTQKLRRRLGSIVDEIVIAVRDMDESQAKREVKRELAKIGDAIRALGERILGKALPA